MAQTQIKGLYDLVTYTWNTATQSLKGNLDTVAAELQSQLALDPVAGKERLGEFARSLAGLKAGNVLSVLDLRDKFAAQGPDVIWAIDSAGKQIILGATGNDSLSGSDVANDAIQGGDGNDSLYGNGGDDTLYGSAGDDRRSPSRRTSRNCSNSRRRRPPPSRTWPRIRRVQWSSPAQCCSLWCRRKKRCAPKSG